METTKPFWQQLTLDDMNDEQWEALCDGCGKCCMHKLIDADDDNKLYFTCLSCDQLDTYTCRCKSYENRFELGINCIKITREIIHVIDWLPRTCAYRLLLEGKDLLDWHPLRTGSQEAMFRANVTARGIAVPESQVKREDWEDYILEEQP